MVVALVIVSILLIGSLALNFLLIRVLKNTLKEIIAVKYYPGAVLLTLRHECENEMIITDFSRYDDLGIIGITCCLSDKYPSEEFERLGLRRDEVERPQYIPNAVVYSPREGFWKWKSQDGLY